MEIKIQCDCGQRYKMDVEPVNGLMPVTVNCPVCGVDGTRKGNELIQQGLVPAPVGETLPVTPVRAKPRLSLATAQIAAPEAVVSPLLADGTDEPVVEPAAAPVKTRPPSFGLGLLGGLGGALAGAIIYYLIVKATGYRISYFAIGIGGLAGWMAELAGKGEGSKELAGITAVLTLAAIVAAQYLIALGGWHNALGMDLSQSAYEAELQHARQVVQMVPTGSDAEIRKWLASGQADDDNKPNPAAITDDEVKQFRDAQLPGLRDMAAGKITREQYNTENNIDPNQQQKARKAVEGTFNSFFVLQLISKSNLFSMAAAAALAFRLCANA